MSRIFAATAFLACLMIVVTQAQSQDGGKGQKGPMNRNGGPPPGGPGGFGMNPQDLMQRLAALDTNGDGALTSNEVTDPGLLGLMQRADTNSDGSVTQAEVEAVLSGPGGQQNGGGGMMGPPGMNGMKPPRPGEILPEFMQQQLQMTSEQKQQLAVLQQQVDAQLKQILTAEQIGLLQSAAPQGGPGGFGAGPGTGAGVGGTAGRGQKGQNGLNAAGAKGRKNRQQ